MQRALGVVSGGRLGSGPAPRPLPRRNGRPAASTSAGVADAATSPDSIEVLARRHDLGVSALTAAPPLGVDVPVAALGPLLEAVARSCAARGLRPCVQVGGRIVAPDEARRIVNRDRKQVRHLRILALDADGRAAENVLVRAWRRVGEGWACTSPLAPVGRILAGATPTPATTGLPLDTAVGGDIDAVITWVDDRDPGWRALVAPYRTLEVADLDRFAQVDELRFVLRSLDLFAPWFRRIHILTNCAPPPWFRATDRIRWVDHREAIPSEVLPLFNSHAIEAFLHRVPEITERFVYFNDDFMLWDSVGPGTFFTHRDQPVVQLQPAGTMPLILQQEAAGVATPWQVSMANSARLVRDTLGFVPTRLHQHAPYALRRSIMEELESIYAADIARVRATRFRSASDVSFVTFIHQNHALASGAAVVGDDGTVMLRHVNYRKLRRRGRQLRSATFVCVNDGRGSGSDAEYQGFKRSFLERNLPIPSSAEVTSRHA